MKTTGQRLDVERLIDVRDDAMVVTRGELTRLGRNLVLELWFNRTFGTSSRDSFGAPSWSRPMRPDCSLHIYPKVESLAPFMDVWLHFDAKYRVDELVELFGQEVERTEDEVAAATEEQVAKRRGEVKRADLLRMHAYRDAIRRSAGAYVLYPGTERRDFTQYHELLPGIGAFALRPTESGTTDGLGRLEDFINDVCTHVAFQATQHERDRYWTHEAHRPLYRVSQRAPAASFLLGYVKSPDHKNWIDRQHRYNLRADYGRHGRVGLNSRELAAELLLLYGPGVDQPEVWRVSGEPQIWDTDGMKATGYPDPGGMLYFCLGLEPLAPTEWSRSTTNGQVLALWRQFADGREMPDGAPLAVTWLDTIQAGMWSR